MAESDFPAEVGEMLFNRMGLEMFPSPTYRRSCTPFGSSLSPFGINNNTHFSL